MKTTSILLFLFGFFLFQDAFTQIENQAITIHDIQFTEDPYGVSPYENEMVTVTGIVTASAQIYDLGFVFIQDEGGGPWSGIWLWGGEEILGLFRGQEVTVSGQVREEWGATILIVSSLELTGHLKDVVVTEMDPSDSVSFAQNGWEKWESVLVMYKSSTGSKLYISHPKPNGNNDYGEYAVSPKSKSMVKKLGLILAGRITSAIFSSLYVSIVSDSVWYDNSGQMEVEPIEASTYMEMDGVIGIMSYQYSDYKILPRNDDDFVNINVELPPTHLPTPPLSIQEFEKKNIKVYPNPASDFLSITSQEDLHEVLIYDIYGKRLASHNIINDDYKIDVSKLESGPYILQIRTLDNELISARIVIQ